MSDSAKPSGSSRKKSAKTGLKPFLLGASVGLMGGVLLALVVVGVLRYRRAPAPVPAALTVNGQPVSMVDFENQLRASAGPALLQRLVEQTLIEQEAARQKVTLAAGDNELLEKTLQSVPTELQSGARAQGKAALLAHRLLLQGVSEKDKQEVYQFYRPQLTQYEIFVILLATRKDARDVARSLNEGIDFAVLAKNYSLDPSQSAGGRLGLLTMPQIRRYMGEAAATAVARLKPNQVSGACYCPQGLVVLKLGEVRSSYEQLKPSVESILANANRVDLMYRLVSQAKVTSPFLQGPPAAVPGGKAPGILPENADQPAPMLPKPSSTEAPGQLNLPKPDLDE
jgi:parvulin-like peptidyl-prolyl isomerase